MEGRREHSRKGNRRPVTARARNTARRAAPASMAIIMGGAVLAGCGGGPAGAGKAGDMLTVDTAFVIDSLDPQRAFTPTAFVVDHAVYQTLLTYPGSDVKRAQPSLATSFQADAGAKRYTFELDRGARFADGTPVTSADVVFSLQRLANLKANGSYLMDGITVRADGPNKVVLTSKEPNAAIPAIVANPATSIVNSELAKAHGATDSPDAAKTDQAEKWFNSGESTGAGSGPYVLTKYESGSQITLKSSPKPWRGAPPFKTVIVRNMQAAAQATNVQRGKAEVALDVSATDTRRIKGRVTVSSQASRFTFFAFANVDAQASPVTAHPRVREAIRYGLDHDGITRVTGPGAAQMTGVIPSWMPGSLPRSSAVKRDLARAKRAFQAAGPGKDRLTLDYPSDLTLQGVSFSAVAAKMQQNLQQVGFKVRLRGSPIAILNEKQTAGKIDFGLLGRGADFMDGTAYLNMSPGGFHAERVHWTESAAPDVVKLAGQARAELDDAKRAGLVRQWQARLNEVGPYFPLAAPQSSVVSTKDIAGAIGSPQYGIDIPAIRPVGDSAA
ncbi:ABC transporter substrate-binding protein [Actinomadura spongiicola]|nr:ABC transporter substrate-binding protein [Actinomadura spongiicola]